MVLNLVMLGVFLNYYFEFLWFSETNAKCSSMKRNMGIFINTFIKMLLMFNNYSLQFILIFPKLMGPLLHFLFQVSNNILFFLCL